MRTSLGIHHFSHLGAGFWTHISMHLTTSTPRNTLLAGAKVKALSQLHTHFLLEVFHMLKWLLNPGQFS